MNFFNKTIFILLLSLICIKQAYSYPFAATILKNKATNETFHIFKDWHIKGKMDEANAKYVAQELVPKLNSKNKLNTKLLIEDSYSYKGNNKAISSRIDELKKDPSHFLCNLSLIKDPKNTEDVETRYELTIGYNMPTDASRDIELAKQKECVGYMCTQTNDIYDDFCKKMNAINESDNGFGNENNKVIKQFYKKNLEEISKKPFFSLLRSKCLEYKGDLKSVGVMFMYGSHTVRNINQFDLMTNPDYRNIALEHDYLKNALTKETYGFTDMQILFKYNELRKKGHKNFILCAGGHHGDIIEELLKNMGFEIEYSYSGYVGKGTRKGYENEDGNQENFHEIDLKKIVEERPKQEPSANQQPVIVIKPQRPTSKPQIPANKPKVIINKPTPVKKETIIIKPSRPANKPQKPANKPNVIVNKPVPVKQPVVYKKPAPVKKQPVIVNKPAPVNKQPVIINKPAPVNTQGNKVSELTKKFEKLFQEQNKKK